MKEIDHRDNIVKILTRGQRGTVPLLPICIDSNVFIAQPVKQGVIKCLGFLLDVFFPLWPLGPRLLLIPASERSKVVHFCVPFVLAQ